jgi:cytochrome c-type biogenesis protein CcmE
VTRKRRRLTIVVAGMLTLGVAAALVLSAISDSLVFFYSPTDIAAKKPPEGARFRVGGLVQQNSVLRDGDGTVRFRVTDLTNTVQVAYKGILPDLFREGQGVIAEGRLGADGTFRAEEVLAKHDETYMPKEVADALKKSGQWKGER